MFKQTNADWQQGFTLSFDNGWDISVKWDMEDADPAIARTSKTAEVAAFNDDDWWDFKNDIVYPDQETGVQRFVDADQVADMIMLIKTLYLDKSGQWTNGIPPRDGSFDRTRGTLPPETADGANTDLEWGFDWND